MHQDSDAAAQQSRSRRRIMRMAGNLLISIGTLLLGVSIVAATRAPESRIDDAPRSTTYGAAIATASPVAHGQHTATASVRIGVGNPATDQHEVEPHQPTPQPTATARPPLPPRAGEGLIEPLPSVKQSTSPYSLNTAGQPAIHISVPAVGIDADVVEVAPVAVQAGQQTLFEWAVADWAAGHHNTSANPGEGGNIVIAGHDDVRGEVFRGLHDIEVGDEVIVATATASYIYVVEEIHMRLFTNASLEEQISIGAFIGPMPEERLTLVTCWPYQVDTHRLIVVAKPAT